MHHRIEVLIIDDNINFTNRMVDLLKETNSQWVVKSATNHEDAINLLLHSDPEIILLNINLPCKNGIDILKYIKDMGKSENIIGITNQADEYYIEQCRRLGAAYFLDRSYDYSPVHGLISAYEKVKQLKVFPIQF